MTAVIEEYGNPSSLHEDGRRAKQVIDSAREAISDALGALFAEVIFTGSGSESANMAIIGAAMAAQDGPRRKVILGAGEHHCVLHTTDTLHRLGFKVVLVPLGRDSEIDLNALAELTDDQTLLVSVMHANNETGKIQPISEVIKLAHKTGALVHTDAVQTFLKDGLPSPVTLGSDLVSIAAHKINGPKGIGALYIRGGTAVNPLISGGGQERELRAGTESAMSIAGFGEAVRVSSANRSPLSPLRDQFLSKLLENGAVETVTGQNNTLSGHAHVRFPGIDAETLLIKLDRMGLSASSGSACSSGSVEPSHVLLACGYTEIEAKEGLRFTFGQTNTLEEADRGAELVIEAVSNVRQSRAAR